MNRTWSILASCSLSNTSRRSDAAELVRTVMKAVQYIHENGIVHRDLEPENLLFRTPAEDADVMIVDFGLSRVMEEKSHLLQVTEICGTPSYTAPEIFKKSVWSTVPMSFGDL
jgi:calcium/calmodulin-dependent protein kinase I